MIVIFFQVCTSVFFFLPPQNVSLWIGRCNPRWSFIVWMAYSSNVFSFLVIFILARYVRTSGRFITGWTLAVRLVRT